MQWGTPFEAFAAVGTVGALVVALWVVFFHNERVRRSEERSEQAELITGWLMEHVTSKYEKEVNHYVYVALGNASEVVVYDLLVVVTCKRADTPHKARDEMGRIVDTEPHEFEPARDRLARTRLSVLRNGQWKVLVPLSHSSVTADDLDIFFRDHRGVYWRRSIRGSLVVIPISRAEADRDPDAVVRAAERQLGVSEAPVKTDIRYLRHVDWRPT